MSVVTGAWLAGRELRARWPRMLLAAGVVAVLTGAAVTMELLARAREEAVAGRIDGMGPPLTVVPAGTTAEALGRHELGGAVLPAAAPAEVSAALGRSLRRIEGRLVLAVEFGGRRLPLVGLPPAAWPPGAPPDGAIVGSALDHTVPVGASFQAGTETVFVVRVAEETGSIDDASLFVPLATAQRAAGSSAVNELRVYLHAGEPVEMAEARLARVVAGATVIHHDRGAVAGHEAQDSLSAHRAAAYAILAGVTLLCLLIAAHLDAAERRLELATLVAIGARASGILSALVIRSAATAVTGALLGTVAGIVVAAGQDPAARSAWFAWLPVGAVAVAVAVLVAAAASGVVSVASILRDPVRDLQES